MYLQGSTVLLHQWQELLHKNEIRTTLWHTVDCHDDNNEKENTQEYSSLLALFSGITPTVYFTS